MFHSLSPHTYVFLRCLPAPDVLTQFASKMRNAESVKFRPPGFNELQPTANGGAEHAGPLRKADVVQLPE
jgi:hypothetical protein